MSKSKKILASIGVVISLAGGATGEYYLLPDERINGRHFKENLTTNELKVATETLISDIKARKDNFTLNEVFAIEDIIDYKCPNGVKIENFTGKLSTNDLENMLNGKCNL